MIRRERETKEGVRDCERERERKMVLRAKGGEGENERAYFARGVDLYGGGRCLLSRL